MKIPKVCLSKEAVTDSMLVPPTPPRCSHGCPHPQRAESKEATKAQQCHRVESGADDIRVLNEERSFGFPGGPEVRTGCFHC